MDTNNPAIPLLQKLIRNRCVNTGSPDSGNEIVSALDLRAFFSGYGLESTIYEKRPGRANLLVRIPGRDPKAPSLAYMGHMDVVDANPEQWSFPPFGGEIKDGYVLGRGAIDMLNMTSSMAAGLAEYYKHNGPAPGDLIYMAVADEEEAGKLGAQWLTEELWDKTKCDYMITELGGFFIPRRDNPAIAVTVGEKGVSRYRICAKGRSAHGSMPYKADNALVKIAKAAVRLGEINFPIEISGQYEAMVRSLVLDDKLRGRLLGSEQADAALEEIDDPGLAKFIHAAGRMTISPTIISSGEKNNVIPDYGDLVIDVRSLPGQSEENIISEIFTALGKDGEGLEITPTEFFPSNASSTDSRLFKAISASIKKIHPQSSSAPIFISSVSDGRFWRRKGTEVCGFCMFTSEMTMDAFSSMLHGKDEKISLKCMDRAFDFFREFPDIFYGQLKEGDGK